MSANLLPEDSLDLHTLGQRLRTGDLSPSDVVRGVLDRIVARATTMCGSTVCHPKHACSAPQTSSGAAPRTCRSLDCISIFALTGADAAEVLNVTAGFDPGDAYSRRPPLQSKALPASLAGCRVGVPRADQLEFFGNTDAARLFFHAVAALEEQGARRVEIDFAPFLEAARLLYDGPWVAERFVGIRDFLATHPESLFPMTQQIISGGAKPSAADFFAAQYRLKDLIRRAEPVWEQVDLIVTPTAGTVYKIDEVNADPVRLNSNLGVYTNFMNLMDLAAIAVPAGFLPTGLPFGITLFAGALTDTGLCALRAQAQRTLVTRMGATALQIPAEADPPAGSLKPSSQAMLRVAVCGAHMSGLPLNHQLTERGALLKRRAQTATAYCLFALTDFKPPRPGLLRAASMQAGAAIEVEVWQVPNEAFGSFVDGIPGPLHLTQLSQMGTDTCVVQSCRVQRRNPMNTPRSTHTPRRAWAGRACSSASSTWTLNTARSAAVSSGSSPPTRSRR